MADIKSLLLELEEGRQKDDQIMAQVIAALREHNACINELDELVDLDRYRSMSRQVSSSFIVEAAGILKDRRQIEQIPGMDELLFIRVPAPAFHQ